MSLLVLIKVVRLYANANILLFLLDFRSRSSMATNRIIMIAIITVLVLLILAVIVSKFR